LNAIQTTFALIYIVQVTQLVVQGVGFVAIEAVYARTLDAIMATRTVLSPIDNTEFARRANAACCRCGVDHVFCGHG
jgi:hypothetical protein